MFELGWSRYDIARRERAVAGAPWRGRVQNKHNNEGPRAGYGNKSERATRVEVARRSEHEVHRKQHPPIDRVPRGRLNFVPTVWRSIELVTNQISSFGVWRSGARRAACRRNRTGETRWLRPRREMSVYPPALAEEAQRPLTIDACRIRPCDCAL